MKNNQHVGSNPPTFFLSSDGDDLVRSSLAIRDNKVGKLLDELLHCKTLRLVFLLDLQGSAKRWAPGLVTFVPAVACL